MKSGGTENSELYSLPGHKWALINGVRHQFCCILVLIN